MQDNYLLSRISWFIFIYTSKLQTEAWIYSRPVGSILSIAFTGGIHI